MKKKKIISLAICILLIVMGYLLVYPLQSETSQSINKDNCQELIIIQPGETITQEFKCKVDHLNKITFQSPFKIEGIDYHIIVKMSNQIIADEDITCKNANGIAKITFDKKDSMNKNIEVIITNKSKEQISLSKENNTKKTLDIKYYGFADNYFFAWYPLFVAAILIVILSVI